MKTVWIFLFTNLILAASCTSRVPRENPDGSPTIPAIMIPEVVAISEIAGAVVDHYGKVIKSISGRIYCGEGITQRPANRATMQLLDKNKALVTVTTEMDGTYKLTYNPGLKENQVFSISAKCGSIQEIVRKDLFQNHSTVDFWIK